MIKLKKSHRFLSLACIVILLASGLYFYAFSNVFVNNTVVAATTSKQLVKNIDKEEAKLEAYINKKLEIQGSIKEIMHTNDRYAILLLGNNDRNVLCELNPNQVSKISTLKIDQMIAIKGIYKGYLNDVILLNCELVDTIKHE